MKKLLTLLLFSTLLFSCDSTETKSNTDEIYTVDSILQQSEKNFVSADSIDRKSDEVINQKVSKTVEKIQNLETEVKQLKEENNELKTQLSRPKPAGKPYKLLPTVPRN